MRPAFPLPTNWSRLLDWHLPLACILVILLSSLYTYHSYHQLLHDCSSDQAQHLLQELASMQIMGIILASAAASAIRRRTAQGGATSHRSSAAAQHPMLPQAAARRRQQLPLV
jgi:hypothetical protein